MEALASGHTGKPAGGGLEASKSPSRLLAATQTLLPLWFRVSGGDEACVLTHRLEQQRE